MRASLGTMFAVIFICGATGCGPAEVGTDSELAASTDEALEVSTSPTDVTHQAQDAEPVVALASDELVQTPFGGLPARCVQQLEEGERVDDEAGVVRRADGSARALPDCGAAPVSDAKAHAESAVASAAKWADGYREAAFDDVSGGSQGMRAYFKVPSHPAQEGSQLVYLFPGLSPTQGGYGQIVQPVLQYGSNGAWGGHYFTFASWHGALPNGTYVHSAPIRVYVGDQLYGSMWGSQCSASTGKCKLWYVASRDLTRKTASILHAQSLGRDYQLTRVLFALEAYGMSSCSQFPRGGGLEFTDVAVHGIYGHDRTPAWSSYQWHVDPGCGEKVRASANHAELSY